MLKKTVLFLWLLPFFFILHGSSQFFEYLSPIDVSSLTLLYLISTSLLAGLFFLFFRKLDSSAFCSFLCTGLYLFFGSIQDALSRYDLTSWMSKYSVLLSLYVLILLYALYFLKKRGGISSTLKQYLNTVLLVLVIMELFSLGNQSWHKREIRQQKNNKAENSQFYSATISQPDIYFLLFDEFASPVSIEEQTGFKNDLYSYLEAHHFKCVVESRSNYNFTPFSMASVLNMDYLTEIKNPERVGLEEYNYCTSLIHENKVVEYLKKRGYEIRNYSIFDLHGYPSRIGQSFLPLNSALISASTLGTRIWKDLGWHLMAHPSLQWIYKADLLRENKNNLLLLDEVKKATERKNDQPYFLYAHFMMPHAPYYYDEKGRPKKLEEVFTESRAHLPISYAKYSGYASTKIKEMVQAIQKNNPTACIILLGDHGFRNLSNPNTRDFFRNLHAIYFPDRHYESISDSMSNVNEFRSVFNKIFHSDFPLLQDSCILLKDRQ